MVKNYLSYTMAVILRALDNGYQYGFDVMDVTGLPSGTVYPALRRLEGLNLLRSKWEKHSIAQQQARPPRKYYELTKAGRDALLAVIARYRLQEQIPLATREPETSR